MTDTCNGKYSVPVAGTGTHPCNKSVGCGKPGCPVVGDKFKNPHPPFVSLTGRVWEDCNKILLATISQFIDLNVIGWEVVTCLQCGRQEQDCGLDCPVGLAIALRDKISGP